MKRKFLDNILCLMQMGFVLPVLAIMEQWAAKADHSLVRYFLKHVHTHHVCASFPSLTQWQLLEMAAPPFSEHFIHSVLRVLAKPASPSFYQSGEWQKSLVDFIGALFHCNSIIEG